MKLLVTILIISVNILNSTAQNGGFEINSVDGCRQQNGLFTISPFNLGRVLPWLASHGTPQLNISNCPTGENDVHSDSFAAYMSFGFNNKEGIFMPTLVKKDESYNIRIAVKGLSSNSRIVLSFTTGLLNEVEPIAGGNPNIPTPTTQQVIFESQIPTSWEIIQIDEFIVDADYNQIWIYPIDGDILVDDFSMNKSCCEPYKVWQNISNPPNTYVNNYIKAGQIVDSAQSIGKVIIKANSEPVKFEAGQHIELLPGFETEPGAMFLAEIRDCGEKKFEISINEIAPWVLNDFIEPACFKAFEVSACFGSGKYSYSWDNGFGENRGRSGFPHQSDNINLNSPQWLFVTVIDEISNDTLRQGIHIPATQFIGSFNFDLFNVITPNSDDLNDTWVVIDSTKLNSDSFGYNAYHYVLNLFTRFAPAVHCSQNGEDATRGPNQPNNKVGTNKTKGFSFDEIDWIIDDYCSWAENPEAPYSLFGCLRLENCSQATNFTFTITVFCSSGTTSPFELSIDDSLSSINNILIFPNPTSNNLSISSESQEIKRIELFDSRGLLIKDIKGYSMNLIVLPLDDVSSGNYNLRIITKDNGVISKGLIIK